MSLNGLDAAAVQEAYQYALAESAGWFLVKYVSRDSVELYEHGKNGVNEARVAIGRYEESSPLYGLIIYRRRKVLIKYVPEGTSRLLQARTAVHFQDVMEQYSPYETLLEITTSEGLSDTALAAVFPLHTASPALSSNRLNEISEDAEDGAPVSSASTSQPPPSLKPPTRERRGERGMRGERPRILHGSSNSPTRPLKAAGAEASTASPSLASPKSTISQFLVREESGHRSISSLTAPSVASVTEYAGSDRSDTNTEPESAPPSKPDLTRSISPQSISPLPSPDVRSSMSKPLPQEPATEQVQGKDNAQAASSQARPVFAPETRKPTGYQDNPVQVQNLSTAAQSLRDRNDAVARPSTDKALDDDPYDLKKYDYVFKPKPKLGPRLVPQDNKKARPAMPSVAAIPSNIKPQPAKKDSPIRPKSQGPTTMPLSQLPVLPAPPPIPEIPEYNPRPLSRGSVKSLPSHKSTAMTPDKLRLMKAIELRKKQMRRSQGAEMAGPPKMDADIPAVPNLAEQPSQQEQSRPQQHALSVSMEQQEASTKKADSGIEMDYREIEKREDKKTLELLESPRKEVEPVDHEPDRAEEQDIPTPTAADDSLPTPKASAQAPPPVGLKVDDNLEERPSNHEASVGSHSPELAQVPTLVEPSVDNLEPSLDERQIFGDEPYQRTAEEPSMLEAPQKSPRRQNSDLAKRRRGYIEPLHLEDMSSDDEFVEELRSATLHQAKPITVAKSPITESFIRRPSYSNSAISEASDARTESALQRTDSQDTAHDETTHASSPVSPETSPRAERQDPMAGLKRNVSSGISRRIQALADVSYREASPHAYAAQAQSLSPEAASTLPSREYGTSSRGALRPSRSRTSSLQKTARLSARMSASQQPQAGGSIYQHENAPVMNVHRDPATNRDSVSVTARIVRPPTNDQTPPAEELHHSSYSFNDSRPVTTESMAQLTRIDTSTPPLPSRSESAASISPEAKYSSQDAQTRTMHSSTRGHFGRHKQSVNIPATPLTPHPDDFPAPPASAAARTQSSTSLASAADDTSGPKEGTRTSRFFKRMSNMATKRRSVAQASVASEKSSSSAGDKAKAASRDGENPTDMPPAVLVGSLNVQFPDSLLWKRRIVSIDHTGNLCFAISQAMEHQRGAAKKFALTDFRMPYVPDLDRQELPFSVMLDFVDGTTLQAACEDTMTHRQVVHVLKSYWKTWQGQ